MRYAILSDIHGNIHALDAVLADVERRRADRIIILGDMVGYGSRPLEVVRKCREVGHAVLAGNHDHATIGLHRVDVFNERARQAWRWTKEQLDDDARAYLASRPLSFEENGLLFTHASPDNPEQWFYVQTEYEAERAMAQTHHTVVFIGHTHRQVIFYTPQGRLINVGSVGQPRDNDPRAAYGLYDTELEQHEFVRVEYDIETAAKWIMEAGLPETLATRLHMGI